MKPKPVDRISFGIYKGTKKALYGHCDYGVFKERNIEIYSDTKDRLWAL